MSATFWCVDRQSLSDGRPFPQRVLHVEQPADTDWLRVTIEDANHQRLEQITIGKAEARHLISWLESLCL